MTRQGLEGKIGETPSERRAKRESAAQGGGSAGRPAAAGATIGVVPPSPRQSQPHPEQDMARRPRWQPLFAGSGRLQDRVALITGGDSGIGRAVAALFAREGADLVINYHQSDGDADETVKIVQAEGRRALAVKGDIGHPEVCRDLVERAVSAFGHLDIVINNAAEQHPADDIRAISNEQLLRTFQTNIFSMFYIVQAALPHLGPGSAIVNCSSLTMYAGSPHLLDYSATKGAIAAFTRSLSEALVAKGIRVNGVAPGPIWTPLNPYGGAEPEKAARFGEDTPMKRPGEPSEVAPCFLFLACADSSYMSGQMLHPNGGTIVNG